MLRFLVLARHDQTGRHVRDPHGRIRRVHRLPARSGGPEDVDAEVCRVDLEIDLLGLGKDRDGRGRRVDPALRLGLGNALHAVHPGLVAEPAVGAFAVDGEDRFLDRAWDALR